MKFSTRVLLFVLGVTLTVACTLLAVDDRASRRLLNRQFGEHYLSLGRSLAGAFVQVEAANDVAARNALRVLISYQERHSNPTEQQLHDLAAELQVSTLGLYDVHGVSEVFADDPNARGATRLFNLCPKLEQQLLGERKTVITPFAVKANPNRFGVAAEKFAYTPSTDGQHVLAATLLAANMGEYLRDATMGDEVITSITMRSKTGIAMASASNAAGSTPRHVVTWPSDRLLDPEVEGVLFRFDAASSIAECCECVGKGMQRTEGDTGYILEIVTSLSALHHATNQERLQKLWLFGGLLAFCLATVPLAARRLVARIERIGRAARSVIASNDLNLSLEDDPRADEVGHVTRAFNEMLRALREGEKLRAERESMRSLAHMASQLAHDIRSPVAALQIVSQHAPELHEEKRLLMRDAIRRINDIANNLLTHHRTGVQAAEDVPEANLVASLVQSTVSERRIIADRAGVDLTLDISAEAYDAFAEVDSGRFQRALANLINNAVEASPKASSVHLQMRCDAAWVSFVLRDQGQGIAPENLARVLRPGMTIGKEGGHGLGLSGAQEAIADWGGSLRLESALGRGTSVHFQIPRAPPAPWFAGSLQIPAKTCVLVLDDDDAIGRVWRQRIQALDPALSIEIRVCKYIDDFVAQVNDPSITIGACLVDYELLGEDRSGLDVVMDLGLERKTTVITSHYDDPALRARCVARNIKIVPKSYAAHVPLTIL